MTGVVILFLAASACNLDSQAAASDPSRFEAAYFHPVDAGSVITLFPIKSGKPVDIALPADLPRLINLISFAPDGKSAYLQIPSAQALKLSDALVKIEFGPTRQNWVPGSGGLSDISSLTISPQSDVIFVSALGGEGHECGAYEINPHAGTHRALRAVDDPDCGGAMGSISPDGKRVLSTRHEQLSLVDLRTGETRSLGTGRATWSPDGHWIAASSRGQIILIDTHDLSHRQRLGSSGVNDDLVWSPDSRYLLFVQKERGCLDDAEGLAMVDVETGKRSVIESSHCSVTSSAVGWIDSAVLP